MPDSVRIVLALSIICLVSGTALGGLYNGTKERIEIQVLENKQMPAVRAVMEGADNDLLNDRKSLDFGEKTKRIVFPAKKGSDLFGVALEFSGKGFGGDVGVMMGIDLKSGKLAGIGITTMSETPGVGTRAKEATFTKQFKGMSLDANFNVKADGGVVDAVTGATVTSRAVCSALRDGAKFYKENKDKILTGIQ